MAGLDRCGKSRPHRDSISGPFRPYPVAIPTELHGPLRTGKPFRKYRIYFHFYKDVPQYVMDLKSQSLCLTGHIIMQHVCCFFSSVIAMLSDGRTQQHPDLPYKKGNCTTVYSVTGNFLCQSDKQVYKTARRTGLYHSHNNLNHAQVILNIILSSVRQHTYFFTQGNNIGLCNYLV